MVAITRTAIRRTRPATTSSRRDPAVGTGTGTVPTQVVAVVNFPPRRIAGFASEVLVLGGMGVSGEVWLLEPSPTCPEGTRIG